MKYEILSPSYERDFVDTHDYAPTTVFYLRGLAAAIQDSHISWRPKLSELIKLLREKNEAQRIAASGASYGAAKQIKDYYPGPAILLFCAAVDAIIDAPQTELKGQIEKAEQRIRNARIDGNEDIKISLKAAYERASFDNVTQKIRGALIEGLMSSGKYEEETIKEKVQGIVNTSHDVRHRALVDRCGWHVAWCVDGVYFCDATKIKDHKEYTDLFSRKPAGDNLMFGKSFLNGLMPYAQDGCAFTILGKLEELDIVP